MTDAIFDRLPPANLESEQSYLGSIIMDANAYLDTCDLIKPDMFYHDAHKTIFKAVSYLRSKSDPVDIVSVQEVLRKHKKLEAIGGTEYLMALFDCTPTAAHALHYAKIVHEKSVLRSLDDMARQISAGVHQEGAEVNQVVATAQKTLMQIAAGSSKGAWASFEDLIPAEIHAMGERSKGADLQGIPTGISQIDRFWVALMRKSTTIIAGLPSRGKSALVWQIVLNAAKAGHGVAVFSLEMSKEQIALRSIQQQSGIIGGKLRTGHVSDEEWGLLAEVESELRGLPIFVNDKGGLHYSDVCTQTRRMIAENNIEMVVVDYAQLIAGDRGESRTREVGIIIQSLRDLCFEQNLVMIVLSQLSRMCEKEGRRPHLSDLRDSGEIEGLADRVAFVHRDYKDKDDQEILLTKDRILGSSEIVLKVRLNKQWLRFDEVIQEDARPETQYYWQENDQ